MTSLQPSISELPKRSTPITLEDIIYKAIECIPPLWPLDSFVAVNPFLGLQNQSFFNASGWVRKIRHGNIFMEPGYYLEQFSTKNISEQDFQSTQSRILSLEADFLEGQIAFRSFTLLTEYLSQGLCKEIKHPFYSFADFVDKKNHQHWNTTITDEISKWSSVYFDQGQSLWPMPWREESFWNAWLKASSIDQNPEWLGLKGFRKIIKTLPSSPMECIGYILKALNIPDHRNLDYLQRLIVSISGWAGYVQFLNREINNSKDSESPLIALLAIRMVFELGLFNQFPEQDSIKLGWKQALFIDESRNEKELKDRFALYLSQAILEDKYIHSLILSLKSEMNTLSPAKGQKTLQAVFCIDVRSEAYRTSLESESSEIETSGFAGFFGISIQYFLLGSKKGMNLCPVLINPIIKVRQGLKNGEPRQTKLTLRLFERDELIMQAWNSFKSSAISCFSFVESIGLGFLGLIFNRAFPGIKGFFDKNKLKNRFKPIFQKTEIYDTQDVSSNEGMNVEEEIKMAADALKNMGLTDNFASLVLMVGHGSESANNPYASSLDCGACGGHSGEINAKILVSILNNPPVRIGLKDLGIQIPNHCFFIAGLHNTTTDELSLYDLESVPESFSKELQKVKEWTIKASKKARLKRSNLFPQSQDFNNDLKKMVINKSQDWAQVRPEWGLAGNAAFIAAPRLRTQGLDLKGRVFLHNYESNTDLDNSILELILNAPMVVASWINLQYYASTVDNKLYGSGNKTIHNVVGKLGVWQGNGGDLQTGLPLQSLHDGNRWVHEPLRLSVFLEASKEIIEQKIQKSTDLKNLIFHHWIHIFSLDPQSGHIYRLLGENNWKEE